VYSKLKSDAKGEAPLEPNHTHFIFTDDGTKHKHGSAIKFRTLFERTITGERNSSEAKTNDEDKKQPSASSHSHSGDFVVGKAKLFVLFIVQKECR
jgi:hypothetical protein